MGCDDWGRDYAAEAKHDKMIQRFFEALSRVDKLPLKEMTVGDLHKLINVWHPNKYHETSESDVKTLQTILKEYE